MIPNGQICFLFLQRMRVRHLARDDSRKTPRAEHKRSTSRAKISIWITNILDNSKSLALVSLNKHKIAYNFCFIHYLYVIKLVGQFLFRAFGGIDECTTPRKINKQFGQGQNISFGQ